MNSPRQPVELSALAEQALRSDRPVLLLDTSVILDILRCADPDDARFLGAPGWLKKILTGMGDRSDPSHTAVITEVVQEELGQVREAVASAVGRRLTSFVERMAVLQELDAILWRTETAVPAIRAEGMLQRLTQVSEAIEDSALVLASDEACSMRAVERVRRADAPASRGKEELRDCLIVEHYLALSRQLRAESFDRSIAFACSDEAGYGKPPNKIRAPLDAEFTECRLVYRSNLASALSVFEP